MNTTAERTDNGNTRLKGPRRCNIYPHVWAAIYGCTGKATRWHHGIGNFGRPIIEYSCPECYAAKVVSRAAERTLGRDFFQRMLQVAQDSAGVENYRYAVTKVVSGRPVLVRGADGRVLEDRRW